MRSYTIILVLVSIISSCKLFAQPYFQHFESFETTLQYVEIDSTDSTNIWQVGQPQKPYFDTAYAGSHTMVTDTINSYPINDTSSFVLKVPKGYAQSVIDISGELVIRFHTKFQTDSLKDFGRIEFSGDSGASWHVMNGYYIDTSYLVYDSNYNVYVDGEASWWVHDGNLNTLDSLFTGISSGWQEVGINFRVCNTTHPKNGNSIIGCFPKSIWLKFTFISDSIPDSLDGWMIDSISIGEYLYLGVPETDYGMNSNYSYLKQNIPNPLSGQTNINYHLPKGINDAGLLVHDINGKVVKEIPLSQSGKVVFNRGALSPGVYFYSLIVDGVKADTKRMVIMD